MTWLIIGILVLLVFILTRGFTRNARAFFCLMLGVIVGLVIGIFCVVKGAPPLFLLISVIVCMVVMGPVVREYIDKVAPPGN